MYAGFGPDHRWLPTAFAVPQIARRLRCTAWLPLAAGPSGALVLASDELSGGQCQRAWIAMAVAQGTPVLLLDEPTTYLDLAHQIDVLDLVAEGAPADVITAETVEDVFGLRCQVTTDPVSRTPLVIPVGRHHAPEPESEEPAKTLG